VVIPNSDGELERSGLAEIPLYLSSKGIEMQAARQLCFLADQFPVVERDTSGSL
jgi:hypothetical protein